MFKLAMNSLFRKCQSSNFTQVNTGYGGVRVRHSKKYLLGVMLALAQPLLTSCSIFGQNTSGSDLDSRLREQTQNVVALSFEPKGQAGLDRLKQDRTQEFCSTQRAFKGVASAENALDPQSPQNNSISQLTEQLRLENLALIQQPKDSNYVGDFKRGELIAQDGRGKTWTDPQGSANGGNCYNCHRLSKNEISYGTLGPSLYQYGKLRGISSLDVYLNKVKEGASDPLIQYTWGVLMNSKAYDLCTVMPRFGVTFNASAHEQNSPILTQEQIKDLMSLLLDPRSPVND
jgi:sulfur-oxidizing protein SoxX